MPKGSDPVRQDRSWERGKKTVTQVGRGKGASTRTSYAYDQAGGPTVAQKTGDNRSKKYNPKAKTYEIGRAHV